VRGLRGVAISFHSRLELFYNRTIILCNNMEVNRKPSSSAAFLLAQVGAHAAAKFGERLAGLNLVPAHAGILRILAATPAMTQQALATALGTLPSRLVALIDDLESRGLVERRPHGTDRRSHALHLTEAGKSTLQAIGHVARDHQQLLLAALSEAEQRDLAGLLERVADQQGLIPRVHPGYAGTQPLKPRPGDESTCSPGHKDKIPG
jgi:DNA-binding MarR family transcriptional regulator